MSLAYENSESKHQLNQLRVQVLAAELHLTYFAKRSGKDSSEYQRSLRDFATAWYLLKKNRSDTEFIKDVTGI